MSTALALTSCEAQGMAVAGGQNAKSAPGAGSAAGETKGFKKKLEEYEAMVIPAQQPVAVDGSMPNTEAGMQNEPEGVLGVSGVRFAIEGFEMPKYPSDVAVAQTQAQTVTPGNGMPQEGLMDGKQADSTPEQHARMQTTTPGGENSTPGITQDQILETVGAYIDAAAETGRETTGGQMPQTMSAQTAAPPETEQVQTVAAPAEEPAPRAAKAAGESAEFGTGNGTAQAEPTEAAAPAEAGQTAAETSAMRNPHDAPAVGEQPQDTPAKADSPEQPQEPHHAVMPGTDAREPAPVGKDAGTQAAAQAQPEEAAQYTKENVLRIVDKVSTQAREGRYDLEVELKPDFLGKVSIKLTMEDGTIRMHVKTDDMFVKGMLTDQASLLQNELKEKGITLSSFDVTYENQASLSGEKQPFEQNDGGRRQGVYYAQAETARYEPAAEPYSFYIGNSSVEFLA